MDYSSHINDADNPAGASPWGSSPETSPQPARTSSYPTSGDAPSSPTPYRTNQSSVGYSQDDTMGGGSYNRPESSAGTASATESDGHRPDTAESVPGQPDRQRQPPAQQEYQAQQHQRKSEPQRYHSGGRQAQNPQGPHYKLQAKITGLERTGRKDPIMRFDVHVSNRYLPIHVF